MNNKEPWLEAAEVVKPYIEELKKLSDKQVSIEFKQTGNAINEWSNATPTFINKGTANETLNPEITGASKSNYWVLSARFQAAGYEAEARKAKKTIIGGKQ